MKSLKTTIEQKPLIGWLLFLATLVVVFLLGLLASSVMERRAEASFVNVPVITSYSIHYTKLYDLQIAELIARNVRHAGTKPLFLTSGLFQRNRTDSVVQ